MHECMLELANELNKNEVFINHRIEFEKYRNTLKSVDRDIVFDLRPPFLNARGYLYALDILSMNMDEETISLALKNNIFEILNYEDIDNLKRSCKEIGEYLDNIFVEILGMPNKSSKIIQEMTPVGRKAIMEIRVILHRKGLIKGISKYSDSTDQQLKQDIYRLDKQIAEDRYFVPLKKDYRVLANIISDKDIIKKQRLIFYQLFISFLRVYKDFLYDLISGFVPIISLDTISSIRIRKTAYQMDLFSLDTSMKEFLDSKITYFLVEGRNGKITYLLIIMKRKIFFNSNDLNIHLKGLLIDSNFRIE